MKKSAETTIFPLSHNNQATDTNKLKDRAASELGKETKDIMVITQQHDLYSINKHTDKIHVDIHFVFIRSAVYLV